MTTKSVLLRPQGLRPRALPALPLPLLRYCLQFFNTYSKPKPNLSSYSPYYAEACNEFAVPISAKYCQGYTATRATVQAVANHLKHCVRFARSGS